MGEGNKDLSIPSRLRPPCECALARRSRHMATAFAASATERAALLRDPDAFAARAEHVLSGLLRKIRTLEAEHAAERINTEQAQHRLENEYASLREDKQRLATQHAAAISERTAAVEARNASIADAERLTTELRSVQAELMRTKEGEREEQQARKRLLEVNERTVPLRPAHDRPCCGPRSWLVRPVSTAPEAPHSSHLAALPRPVSSARRRNSWSRPRRSSRSRTATFPAKKIFFSPPPPSSRERSPSPSPSRCRSRPARAWPPCCRARPLARPRRGTPASCPSASLLSPAIATAKRLRPPPSLSCRVHLWR